MFSIKRVPLVILSRKETSIVAIVRWQKQTRYMCIFFVLNKPLTDRYNAGVLDNPQKKEQGNPVIEIGPQGVLTQPL